MERLCDLLFLPGFVTSAGLRLAFPKIPAIPLHTQIGRVFGFKGQIVACPVGVFVPSEATKFSGLEDLIRRNFDLFSISESDLLMTRFTLDSPVLARLVHSDTL
jgi:hypothetical protein